MSTGLKSPLATLRIRPWLSDLGWAIAFALAYGQSPLYTSNQNQYFLQGMARAGYGQLAMDWLATTVDPTPVFSWMVYATTRWLSPAAFYLEYGLLLALYFFSLRSLLLIAAGPRWRRVPLPLLSLGLIALHAAPTRLLLGRLLGAEAGYLLEGGLAGQRLLGPVFQPSAFGVLIVTSVALFLHERRVLAVLAAVLAATFHPTYLLSAAALTAAYIWVIFRQRGDSRGALALGLLALLAVLPTLLLTLSIHRPSSPGMSADALRLLAVERIPQHALPAEWFGPTSLATLGLILVGLWLVRGKPLLPILALPTLLGAALSLVQLLSGNLQLALVFPWRLSTWLAPIGSGLILVALIQTVPSGRPVLLRWRSALLFLAPALALLLALSGLARTLLLAQERRSDNESALFRVVRSQLEPGYRYLIPPKLQRFRLETGAPAFVDFKSIPYRDRELLEWNERLRLTQFFYRDQPVSIDCGLLPRIAAIDGITHVVIESDQFGLDCPGFRPLYRNPDFALYAWSP